MKIEILGFKPSHIFVLGDVVAFELGCLTASVFTCSAPGSLSNSFVVFKGVSHSSSVYNVVCIYEGFCLTVFSDLKLDLSFSAPPTQATPAVYFVSKAFCSELSSNLGCRCIALCSSNSLQRFSLPTLADQSKGVYPSLS